MARPAERVSFSAEKSREFFKVFIPKYSSKFLSIPPAFVSKFIPTTLEMAIVKDANGKYWNVALVTKESNLNFGTGWEEFARTHFLEFGDFLLFTYRGDSLFEVKIFGKNGCNKEVAYPKALGGVKIEEEKTQSGPSKVHKKTLIEKRGLNGSTKRPSPSEEYRGESREVSAKILAEQRTPRPTRYVAPKNPHFVTTITNSSTSQRGIYIPRAMAKEIKIDRNALLRCWNDKSWPVKITFLKDGRGFINDGWPKFRSENSLTKGDKCVFELVLGKGMTCKQMKVGFIRAGAKRTRTH